MEVFGVQRGFCCWWHVLTTADPLCRCCNLFLWLRFRAMLEEVKQDKQEPDSRSCLLLISTWWTSHDRLFTMFAVMGIPVTVGGFVGAVAQMSMVPCFSKNGPLVVDSTYLLKSSFWILLERFYLKSLFKCEQWMVIVCKCARVI